MALYTQRFDNFRTGANLTETTLTLANVNSTSFGKLFERRVDGSLYAQPLIVPNLNIGGKQRNVLFVATMHNSVYAFDADDPTASAPLWHQHLADSIQLPADDIGPGNYLDMEWEVGIVSTPVISGDRSLLWCVSTQRPSGLQSQPIHTLWKLNLTDGVTLASTVITANLPNGATIISNQQLQRSALTFVDNSNRVYVAFASYGDHDPYYGWVLSFDAQSLQGKEVFCTSSFQNRRGGIWMAGQGPSVDAAGNLYVMTGNANFNQQNGDYGDCALKLSPDLHLLDYFTPHNSEFLNLIDADLGSGGILVIPNSHLCCGGGKESILYLFDQNSMGKADLDTLVHTGTDRVLEKIFVDTDISTTHHIHGAPTYYPGPSGTRLYVWAENDNMKAYSFDGSSISQNPVSVTNITDPENVPGGSVGMPGGFHAISANGNVAGTGVLWASHPYQGNANQNIVPGILRAFDPYDLTKQLWNSRQNILRDDYGNYAKFNSPMPFGGHVYQATMGGLQQKQISTESTNGRPVLVNQDDQQLVVAWNSVSRPSRMNVMSSTDGFTWNPKFTISTEGTVGSPGLTYDPLTKTTFIAWSGDDPGHHLNILQCKVPTLDVWTNKQTIWTDVSVYGLSLAFGAGLLFAAWADDTSTGSVHVATTKDGGASWAAQVTLPEHSDAQPSLVFHNNKLILSWKGISPNHQLSFAECTDFTTLTFVNKMVINDLGNNAGDPGVISDQSPSVAFDADGFSWLSWVTLQSGVLNQIVSEKGNINGFADIPSYHRQFRAHTAGLGPTLCFFKGNMFIAWQANGAPFNLETAVLNRGSVAVYGLLP
jgi:hypothetical protein